MTKESIISQYKVHVSIAHMMKPKVRRENLSRIMGLAEKFGVKLTVLG